MKKRSFLISLIMMIMILLASPLAVAHGTISDKGVFVLPIQGDIGPSVESFVGNQLKKAEELNTDIVILDINTLGGRVDSTLNIQEIIKNYSSKFKFYSFVNNKAESAGVMIALLGKKVYMTEDSTIGSAAVVPFDEKTNSAWSSMLKAQAESNGKPGDIAKATADYNIVISGLKDKGSLLNMTASDAIKLKFADGIANNINEVIKKVEYRGDKIIIAEKNFKVTLSEIISNPYVSMGLLLFGIIALVAEIFIPSFGIIGTLGTMSIVTYFLGNVFAGHASWWALGLFVAGVILALIEFNIPGFGAAGIGGVILISIGIVMSAETAKMGIGLMIISWIIAGVGVYLLIKFGIEKGPLSKMILKSNQEKKDYISYNEFKFSDLIDKEGIARSQLRPSGIATIDGETMDVQSLGEFIREGTKVKIIKIEGSKVFVKRID